MSDIMITDELLNDLEADAKNTAYAKYPPDVLHGLNKQFVASANPEIILAMIKTMREQATQIDWFIHMMAENGCPDEGCDDPPSLDYCENCWREHVRKEVERQCKN